MRELLSPEKKSVHEATLPSNNAVPVATLAARSSDAKGRLIEVGACSLGLNKPVLNPNGACCTHEAYALNHVLARQRRTCPPPFPIDPQAELRQKFGEEVRWYKKQADHLTGVCIHRGATWCPAHGETWRSLDACLLLPVFVWFKRCWTERWGRGRTRSYQ